MSTDRLPDTGYEPIGADGIEGAVTDKFVSIVGPCGDGHTMSHAAARDLQVWLQAKLCAEQS